MILILIVMSIVVMIGFAIVGHFRSRRFWRVCSHVGVNSIIPFFILLVSLGGFRFHMLVVSAAAGVVGFAIAAVVGIPFLLDRKIQESDKAKELGDSLK